MWRDGERGQSIQVGAVLLFGALVIALAAYQAFVVPQQNERVEFTHSQTVQDHMTDLRNAIVSVPGGASPESVSVQLGTQYPPRLVAVNPGPPTGQLRTSGTSDSSVEFVVTNAQVDGETGDFWDGTSRSYGTGGLVYRPNYNLYGGAPTTAYENTVLYNDFGSNTVALAGQSLVDGNRVTLVALDGTYGATQAGTVSPDVQPVSSSTRTVSVTDDGSAIEVELPTKLSEQRWKELLDDEVDPSGHIVDGSISVTDTGAEFETLSFELETGQTYTLQMAKVGIGTEVSDTSESYMTDVSGDGSTVPEGGSQLLVVEVRDRYNNPVSGVTVDGNAVTGSLDKTMIQTGNDGRAAFLYEAPDSVSSLTSATVQFSYDGPPSAGFDGSQPENVDMTVNVQDGVGSGGGAGSSVGLDWKSPTISEGGGYLSDCDDDDCTWDVGADSDDKLDLTGVLEDSNVENKKTVEDATLDFALNDSSVGTVSPNEAPTGTNGEASTTLTAVANGHVRVYVVGGGASDVINITVTNAGSATAGENDIVFAKPSSEDLATIDTNGAITDSVYGITGVQSTGPKELDFTDGSNLEVPYVDGDDNLGTVDENGNQQTLVDPDSYSPGINSDARLAVGKVSASSANNKYQTDTGPFVYFINGNGFLTRVDATGTITKVDQKDGGVSAQAVAGTGDIDGDNTPELVYVNTNGKFSYLDEDPNNGKMVTTDLSNSPALNTPNAVGAPADLDGDGADEIPYISGNKKVKYVNGNAAGDTAGSTTTVVSAAGAEYPVGAADRDDDGTREIIYVDTTSSARLAYADPTSGTVFISDSNGNDVPAKKGTGAS